LTGLFTDLGIELSQFFFKKSQTNEKVECSIYLRLSIIIFFYWLYLWRFPYTFLEIKTLFVAACFLLIALIYDYIRLQFLVIKEEISPTLNKIEKMVAMAMHAQSKTPCSNGLIPQTSTR
jgi:hypothetical protein